QGVVDRRADVAVGGREQGVDPQHALKALEATLGHRRGSLDMPLAGQDSVASTTCMRLPPPLFPRYIASSAQRNTSFVRSPGIFTRATPRLTEAFPASLPGAISCARIAARISPATVRAATSSACGS